MRAGAVRSAVVCVGKGVVPGWLEVRVLGGQRGQIGWGKNVRRGSFSQRTLHAVDSPENQ